jgi:hypothetical protein
LRVGIVGAQKVKTSCVIFGGAKAPSYIYGIIIKIKVMQNTFNYLPTQQFNAKLQDLLEKGHIDEYLVEQIRDYRRFYNDNVIV